MTSRSTVSGEAPGYGTVTTITGCSTSGIWFTRSLFNASKPRHISAMMMTTVETGRLMLKSERSIALPRRGLLVRRGHRRLRRRRCLHRLAFLERSAGIADHLVAFVEPGDDDVVAASRIAVADLE